MVENGLPSAPTEGLPEGLLAPGQVLGDRYQIKSQLGRGGMGEVWRAFDLKLRVDVALKAMLSDLFKNEKRRDLLRREVRAAREVVSPNVCRIFDLIEVDGRELVSMEYVDGGTLLSLLAERGPLDLKEAQDIASQFLAGLEAIHQAGLVHRDVKPENIMITRVGRVVLMDFGLARQEDSGTGTVSGTPAYMAPEQAGGEAVDARADVYSAGVVLAEMVSPDGIKDLQSRQSVWEGIRHEPARVPDSPWAPVLKKAVAKKPEQRFNSAHTLTRALEDVTRREKGVHEGTPYPGLAFFTEADFEYFYGREAEVERMWRTLELPSLLAIIGPSGAGKSSFLRAGLIPARPPGWSFVVATPGSAPFVQLAQALVPEFSGDTKAIQELFRTDDSDAIVSAVGRWRAFHDQAVLVVDQFEELFTQNSVEIQSRFANLMARFVLEADVHVLLSMRDDFLFHCQAYETLQPVFSEITPLGPPVGGALRRALVQPASKCGYRFEDDDLVEEMLAEVEGERGLLPLLAFAVNRLWEERDQEEGLLTREAYERIGGVGGALARHAEKTLEQIGEERTPMVREIFRNLMTAQGTRAARDVEALLSVFDSRDRESAGEVLRQLVDARLLTTFDIDSEGGGPRHRVEIIHESLLSSWPRLVGWRTQDADSARLRDELRQAARTWDEHERSDDLLWTGSAYREFSVWRERYPGGLTEVEEDFARAMTRHAKRRKRRRRIAAAAALLILASVAIITTSLWRRSQLEARRAEAANLVSLGQLELESYPSATVAHAIASLELADGPGARLLALEALWKGPTALVVNGNPTYHAIFTPDADWLVQSDSEPSQGNTLRVIGKNGASTALDDRPKDWVTPHILLNPTGEVLWSKPMVHPQAVQHFGLWSIPDGRILAEARYEPPAYVAGLDETNAYLAGLSWNEQRFLILVGKNGFGNVDAVNFDGTTDRLGSLDCDFELGQWARQTAMDVETGQWLGVIEEGYVAVIKIGDDGISERHVLGRHDGTGFRTAFHPRGRILATSNADGEIRLWDPSGMSPPTVVQGPPGIVELGFKGDGSVLTANTVEEQNIFVWAWSLAPGHAEFLRKIDVGRSGQAYSVWDTDSMRLARGGPDQEVRMWSLQAPADAEPLSLLRGDVGKQRIPAFHPHGKFLATSDESGLTLWPLTQRFPSIIRRHDEAVKSVVFEPEGRWLASAGLDDTVRLWPLEGVVPAEGRIVFDEGFNVRELLVSPGGDRLSAGGDPGPAAVVPLDGEPATIFGGLLQSSAVAFSADERLAAVVALKSDWTHSALFVWEAGAWDEPMVFEPEKHLFFENVLFQKDGKILLAGDALWRADPQTGESELLHKVAKEGACVGRFSVTEDGRQIALVETSPCSFAGDGRAVVVDLEAGTTTPLESHGDQVWSIALDPTGTMVVTGDQNGVIRVGPATGGEPHLLLGHEGRIWSVAIDPLGRWIASGGEDTTVRLWPMPDLSKPPLHTLPQEELITMLKTLTNYRVVRNEDSATGWELTLDPFPGWTQVPEW